MQSQVEKARMFQQLHKREGAFIIPNPWDIGSARLLALLGFEALASTSAGFAFSRGQLDGGIGRDQMMAHLTELAAATELPLSADLENGFGAAPATVAETIRLAAVTGIVGGSIEDASGNRDDPIYALELAAERVRAAAEAVRGLDFPFTLTARAENYLAGRADLKDTIKRLQAYQEAGADVLYAPGLKSQEEIAAVVSSLDKPVNVVMGLQGVQLSLQELAAIGVKRVSVGGSLARAALGAFIRAAEEMREHGTFTYGEEAVSTRRVSEMLQAAGKL
ncbi:phosphoenolpyruvate phosphomutase family protein [Collimonas fungivorans]|uniref:Phosphoenolpyruvate phosphomutase family protein n=1 Tax=Collimonas fungivorans TaxID=158899 RepID=A0A127PDW4_9BURK|nr:isocitrate lyase/phosphoenolpyruvate mutase family protein [Collimonas fungivorans]AMO95631.1 phosphoenolpyruvate phosphomutase family protein [Collimonas fungivorans]